MCIRAWRADAGRTRSIATSLSKLLALDPDGGRAENVDAVAFFQEAMSVFSGRPSPALLNEEAVWLSKAGRNKEAAASEVQAWIAGYQLEGGKPPNPIEWAPYEPLLTRVTMAVMPLGLERSLMIGAAAFASGDVEIAMPHLHWRPGAGTPKTPDEKQQWAGFLLDAAEVASVDLTNKRIDAAGVAESFIRCST